MKRWNLVSSCFAWVLLGIGLACIADIAFAQPAAQPVDPKVTGEALLAMVNLLGAGKYLLAISTVITLLTRLFTYVADRLKPDWLPAWLKPWIAAGLGVVGAFVAALASGAPWPQALVTGLVTGSAASGLWSLVVKHALTGRGVKAARAEGRRLANGGR